MTGAIKTALRYIKEELWECSVIGIMDADGQHLADDMEKLLMKAAAEPHALIIGARTINEKVPWRSRFGNLITRRVFQMTTGTAVSDTQSAFKIFFRIFFKFPFGLRPVSFQNSCVSG